MSTDSEQVELSAAARSLIDIAMEQDVPPADAIEGSWGMVVSRLTLEMSRVELPTPAPAPARRWLGIGVATGVVAVVGAVLWLTIRPAPDAASTTVPPAARRPASVEPPATSPSAGATPSPATLPGALSTAHAQLLVDAEAVLPTEPARALELLDRHAEVAPLVDAERRMALRISALCALGRVDEAKSQATAFFATSRGSQWTARVRASCAG